MPETIYYSKFEEGKEKRKEFTLKILELYKDQIKGKVFIKPNMVSYEDYPTTTHPETLETPVLSGFIAGSVDHPARVFRKVSQTGSYPPMLPHQF